MQLDQHGCSGSLTVFCERGDIRLAGDLDLRGGSNMVGRVEICVDEVWGTVCDDWFTTEDATVACRQLGFYDQGTHTHCPAHISTGISMN